MKEETTKIQNVKLVELTRVYKKITAVEMDFEQLDEMSKVIDDTIVVDEAIKVYSKLEEKLRKDAQEKIKDKSDQEALEVQNDFVKKINALSEKETELPRALSKVSQDLCKKAKITIAEFKVLKELGLV